MWNLKGKTNEQTTKQKQSHRYREQTGCCQSGGACGGWQNMCRGDTNLQLYNVLWGCNIQHKMYCH